MEAELLLHELTRGGFELDWRRVEDEHAYVQALHPSLDVILADYSLPSFGAPRALALLRSSGLDVPFIVVSGSITEETAVEVLRNGAFDYLLKDRLTRLAPAVQRALEHRHRESAKRAAEQNLRVTEERMRFALEASNVGIWEIDVATGVTRWSTTLEAQHGLAPGTFEGTREAFLERVHLDDRDRIRAALTGASRDRTDFNVVYRTRWPDRSTHWLTIVGRMSFSDAGEPVRAAGIGLDVTERVVLENQYRQAQKMEAVGQLAGGVAHDFNNILTAIEGYCELVVHELPADHPVQPDLAEIHQAAQRAASLTRQLLAFGRKQVLEPRVIDLRESVTAIAPMLKRLIGENIQIIVRAADEVGRVRADPGQIEQVVLNLAVNARDAMPAGGTLRLEVTDVHLDAADLREQTGATPGRYVALSAGDTGSGIPPELQARIFEPFFTTKEKGKGTGLGLSTVYGIVQQSGGHIRLVSEQGQGTTFTVYLPCVDDPIEDPSHPAVAGRVVGAETVLVVEDEPAVSELIRRVLTHHGYNVLVASAPADALRLSVQKDQPIHLLLSDVILPEMSGGALASRIVKEHPNVTLLYMSGHSDDAVLSRGVMDRGAAFLQKPFTPDTLARKVREVLDQAGR